MVSSLLVGLTMLSVHYGLVAAETRAHNSELQGQVRDLVTRIAELESLIGEVGAERQAVETVTLETLGAILDATSINREQHGPLYVATLTAADRAAATKAVVPPGPPASAAQMLALVDRTSRIRERANTLVRDLRDTGAALRARRDILAAIPSRLPASGWTSSSFGVRNSPFHSGERMHNGLDIAGEEGTPIYAPADGEVAFAAVFGGFGNYIRISHGFGIDTRFAHNSKLLVKKGQKVRRGDQIALLGSSGRSTGPHLHYEVLVHGEPVDPARFIFDGGKISPAVDFVAGNAPAKLGVGGELGDGEINAVLGEAGEPTSSEPAGLLPLTGGAERFMLTASMPGTLGRTTTADVIILLTLLLLATIARLRRDGRRPDHRLESGAWQAAREPAYARSRDKARVWTGRAIDDEE